MQENIIKQTQNNEQVEVGSSSNFLTLKNISAIIFILSVIGFSVFAYLKNKEVKAGIKINESAVYLKSSYDYKIKDAAALKNLLCDKESPKIITEKYTDWYVNCNTNLNAVNSIYTGFGWKNKELDNYQMQTYFSNFIFQRLQVGEVSKLTCQADISDTKKVDCNAIIKASSTATTTKSINFSMYYFKNKVNQSIENMVTVIDFDPQGKKEKVDMMMNNIIKDINTKENIFSFLFARK